MNAPIPYVSVAELATALERGAALIDVREPDEFAWARVPNAELVPLATVPAQLESLPSGRPLYVICKSGGRSASAVEFLRANGVDSVNVEGGTLAWIEGGYPSDSGPPRDGGGGTATT